ncbi:hypothetical protein J437_LFUL004927 [Ladona fulva]|uniref:Uncharacterized protein n=1 Tax=Ladona fulva TaxID=123851 RepID=A0A8K0P119_LADFU|nr:hypothetical protein J437_LFUL004927 [Ladona fulva]
MLRLRSSVPNFTKMGAGKGGNPIWVIFWLLVLIFISFFVAGFCAGWYILILPLTVCIEGLTPLTDLLLKCVQLPHYCAQAMMSGRSPF